MCLLWGTDPLILMEKFYLLIFYCCSLLRSLQTVSPMRWSFWQEHVSISPTNLNVVFLSFIVEQSSAGSQVYCKGSCSTCSYILLCPWKEKVQDPLMLLSWTALSLMFLIKSFEKKFWKVYLYSVFKIVPKTLYFIYIIIINKNALLSHEAHYRYFQIHFCENFIFMCVIDKKDFGHFFIVQLERRVSQYLLGL